MKFFLPKAALAAFCDPWENRVLTGYKRSSRDAYIQRSTRDAYLNRLAAKELVEDISRGEVKASDDLFD